MKPLRLDGTLLYLAFPVLIFAWGWFSSWIALPLTLCLLFLVAYQSFPQEAIPLSQILIISLLSLLWTYLGGVGGFRPQHFDYFKHNLILNNLVRYQWPVNFSDGTYLCYYLAYYLPAAALAKVLGGVLMVKYYIFGWTWLGLALLFAQLYRLGGIRFVLFFMFFNSGEALLLMYEAIKSPHTLSATLSDLWTNDHTIELIQTPGGLMFPSHVESFTAAPQHSLPAWLVIIYVLRSQTHKSITTLWVIFILCLYWSPLVGLGLLPFIIYKCIQFTHNQLISTHFKFVNFSNHLIYPVLSLLVIGIPILLYFAGHVPMHDLYGWWPTFLKTQHQFLLLATFIMVEVGVWVIVLILAKRQSKTINADDSLLWVAISVLFLLALFRYGHYNDLARRACLPAYGVICWSVYQLLHSLKVYFIRIAFVAWLIVLPLKHHLRWLTPQPYTATVNKRIEDFTPYSIHYLSVYHQGEFDVVAQYLGSRDAWYRRYLCPTPKTKPVPIQ